MSLLDRIKSQIDAHKVVSFDIFDTLLVRPYVKPTDLFLHMEKVFNIPFFCYTRQEIEEKVRIRHKELEDITFDMIYEEIDDKFKDMKQKEMDWEEMVLRANPELKQVYDYAKEQGKKIIIASDMYLPTEFLAKVLRKNGFDGWDKLYVSGDLGKSKYSGNLYKKIIDDCDAVKANYILHIGDSKKSDFEKAREFGLDAVLYKSVLKQYLKSNFKSKLYNKMQFKSIGKSILLGCLSNFWQEIRFNKNEKKNYWEELGYFYAGPLSYGYARFYETQAIKNDLNKILFVARDGWLLQQVFELFDNKIETLYVYAPRILNLICRLDYNPKNIMQTKAIVENFAKINPCINSLLEKADLNKPKDYHNFIKDNFEVFSKEANKMFDNYKKYLSGMVSNSDKVGLGDTITGEFSSQKLIQNTISNKVMGLYWGVLPSQLQSSFEYAVYTNSNSEKHDNKSVYTENWNFVEFLLTSPEFPIKNLSAKCEPIYDEHPDENEIKRSQIYPQIANGALLFAKKIQELFGGNDIYLTASDLVEWINAFISSPSKEDVKNFVGINYAIDSNHNEYVPLFATEVSVCDFFRSPKKVIKKLEKTIWRTVLQSCFVAACHPVSFRLRGLKKMHIVLFPKLKKQYFMMALTPSNDCFYKFIVGNPRI